MPPGLAAALGDSAVRDLIAYLTSPEPSTPAEARPSFRDPHGTGASRLSAALSLYRDPPHHSPPSPKVLPIVLFLSSAGITEFIRFCSYLVS